MKQEIKERIEKIRKGEVPEGYRKTKNCIIPSNWDETIFSSMMDGFSSGSTPSRNNKSFFQGDNLWITSAELNYNVIKNSNEKITDEAIKKANLKVLNPGTFVIAITGLEAAGTRGSCGIVGKKLTTSQSCMALIPKSNLDLKFLFQYYCAFGEKIALKYTQGTKQQSYNGDLVRKLPIIKVPLNEQNKITEILHLWDKAIELKEKLIEVRKEFKRGLMQKLLTGEIRFFGFNDEWDEMKIIDIINYEQPNGFITKNIVDLDKALTPVLTANKSFILGSTFDDNGIYTETPVIIFDDFTIDNKYVDFPFKIRSSAIKILKTKNDDVDIKFVYELMQFIKFPLGEHKRYYISEYQSVKIKIPIHIEQVKIVEVSNDLDSELNLLNKELNQLKEQKKGLMQLLLTGIVRVEVD